jgi:LPXTG-motif cell wall-anchored protein
VTKEDIVKLTHLAGASLALGVLLGPVAAAHAQTPYPPSTGNGQVNDTSVKPGECVTFSGDGYLPASPVQVTDNGATVTTVTTGTDGTFSTQICPTVLGVHLIRGTGTGTNGAARVLSASVTVASGLATTGAANTVPMVAVGAGMILAGAGAVVVASRRRRVSAAA